MSALFNPSPLVLVTLQSLSVFLGRSTALARDRGVAGYAVGGNETRAFGGLDMTIERTGQAMPAKLRYGAITVAPRPQGSAYSRSPGVHPAIDRAYDNPGVRFGDRVKGRERPMSASGETSCHFSQTSVSQTSPIREMTRAARGGRRLTESRAAAHVHYVEREGAPERIEKSGRERLFGDAFTAEVERRGLDRSAVAQQAYIERAGAAEANERELGRTISDGDLDALDQASFGTIGATVEERTRFWRAVEAAEATPKGDRITINPRENPAWWAKVAAVVQSAPGAARKQIQDALARDDGAPFDVKLPTDEAFALHQWAVGLDTAAPLEVSPGRGGRTQTRIIAELPHELDGRERLQIVRDFTQKLAEKSFPYWAVIHAPDANNDARNYHVHISYYDRPAARVADQDKRGEVWDFEIEELITYKSKNGGAKRRMTRPHQQNRLRETNKQDWITDLRKHWETVSNRVLEDAGVSKRYNLGSYESMGIELAPLKHINPRTFNKERKGELTEEGPILARRQWDAVHDRLVKDHETRARKRQESIKRLADHAARVVAPHAYGRHRVAEVKRLAEIGFRASFQLGLAELHQDLTRLVSDRVASRPKLIMNAVDKEEQQTRKKKGHALDAPPEDRPVAGAALFGLSRRSEIMTFLTTVYDGALKLDRANERRSRVARTNVQLIVQELKAWAAAPGRPLHTVRRYSAEAVQSLDDPARLERREAACEALAQGFREVAERDVPRSLEALNKAVAETTAVQPATAEADRKAPVSGRAASGDKGPSPHSAPPQPDPSSSRVRRFATSDGTDSERPRYRPGRPDDEPRASTGPADRWSRRPNILDPTVIKAARTPPTSSTRSATPPSLPARAGSPSEPPARKGGAEASPTGVASEPKPAAGQAEAKPMATVVDRTDATMARMQVPTDEQPNSVRPPSPPNSHISPERDDRAAGAVQVPSSRPVSVDQSADVQSSHLAQAETTAVTHVAAALNEAEKRSSMEDILQPVLAAGTDRLSTRGAPPAEPAPTPSRVPRPDPAVEPNVSAKTQGAASARTGADEGKITSTSPPSIRELRSGAPDLRPSTLTGEGDEVEPGRVRGRKLADEAKSPAADQAKPFNPAETQITGARRPPKKQRARSRDRGPER